MNKIKKILIIILAIATAFIIVELVTSVYNIGVATKNYTYAHLGPMQEDTSNQALVIREYLAKKRKLAKIENLKYNDRVPIEVIKAEIIKQANIYGNDVQFMLDLASCESTFNNLAENPISSAEGVYQYLYGTWRNTESGRNHISRFDYKANIKEANIDISNEEYFRWDECL